MTLTLINSTDPILHTPSVEVHTFGPPLVKLVDELFDVMWSIEGAAGLAAPQVGLAMRIAVIFDPKCPVIINPQIIVTSKNARMKMEGCLSYPGQRYRVRRWDSVTVGYQTPLGERHAVDAHGHLAQVLQHEIDHLDGRTIAD